MATKKTTPVTEKDLQKSLAELRKDYSDARRSHAAGELPNPQVLKNHRREIARALTAVNANKKEQDNA